MRRLAITAIAAWAVCSSAASALAAAIEPGDALARQAALGFSVRPAATGVEVHNLDPASPAAAAGLADGDVLVRINGQAFNKPYVGEALLERLDGGTPVRLTVRRGNATRLVEFEPPEKPLESIPGAHSLYTSVETPDGARLRAIITRPDGAEGPLYPLLFTQWVSCGSVEYREGSGAREILAKIAQDSGLALVRVERASNGDSEGPACHELDYETEVAHYIHAYKELLTRKDINPGKVYVYGSSLGSTTAPLVALALQNGGYDIAGIAVQGGGAETYYERMLSFDRLYLERRPEAVRPHEIHDEMIARAKFHYEYLINDRNPDDIAREGPAMAAVRADIRGLGDGEHYGRPYAWHQQAAKRNFLGAWAELDAPVLVIFNEFDQFEAEYGHKVIADMTNRLRPGTATFIVQENIGHSNNFYATVEDAYAFRNGEPAWDRTAKLIIDWLRNVATE